MVESLEAVFVSVVKMLVAVFVSVVKALVAVFLLPELCHLILFVRQEIDFPWFWLSKVMVLCHTIGI